MIFLFCNTMRSLLSKKWANGFIDICSTYKSIIPSSYNKLNKKLRDSEE
jgi:hypothetical protein